MKFDAFISNYSEIVHRYFISENIYFAFQQVSNDFNPLHTDTQYARQLGFQDRVMYGNILNALISHFVGMLLPSRDVMILSQDISFHRPVYLNDSIELKAAIDSVSEATNSVNFKLKLSRYNTNRPGGGGLVAKGHVRVGLIGEKQ